MRQLVTLSKIAVLAMVIIMTSCNSSNESSSTDGTNYEVYEPPKMSYPISERTIDTFPVNKQDEYSQMSFVLWFNGLKCSNVEVTKVDKHGTNWSDKIYQDFRFVLRESNDGLQLLVYLGRSLLRKYNDVIIVRDVEEEVNSVGARTTKYATYKFKHTNSTVLLVSAIKAPSGVGYPDMFRNFSYYYSESKAYSGNLNRQYK